ncbi:MAG: hypothetical protein OXD43_14985 [Bacteroidetes bacterium]|nr:hypothetical protein [Bacteroidota bacterium]
MRADEGLNGLDALSQTSAGNRACASRVINPHDVTKIIVAGRYNRLKLLRLYQLRRIKAMG